MSQSLPDDGGIIPVTAQRVEYGSVGVIPQQYIEEQTPFDLEHFREKIQIQVHKHDQHDMVFSLIGVDASLANAFRRILLSHIPTLAIHDVFINQNTSVIQDEVLAHRLGLIPLKGNKEDIRWLRWRRGISDAEPSGQAADDTNTIVLKLKVRCDWQSDGKKKAKAGVDDPNQLYTNSTIYASDIQFEPMHQQVANRFTAERGPIESTNPNVLLAKLRPDQEIDIVCYAQKGTGASHAKWSPVATASYRLLPSIQITEPILDKHAEKFQKCFPSGVIELEEVTEKESNNKKSMYRGQSGKTKAVVKDTFKDTVSRECLRHDEFKDKVKLGRHYDHFVFSVESVGQADSEELFIESVKILRRKCFRLRKNLKDVRENMHVASETTAASTIMDEAGRLTEDGITTSASTRAALNFDATPEFYSEPAPRRRRRGGLPGLSE